MNPPLGDDVTKTTTEWGYRLADDPCRDEVQPLADEAIARELVSRSPLRVLVRREVTSWHDA